MSKRKRTKRKPINQAHESALLIDTLKKMGAHESVTFDPDTGAPRRTYTISLGKRNVIPNETEGNSNG